MMSECPIVLVDTNVWLDHFLCRQRDGQNVDDFVRYARMHSANIVYPVHIVKDVFFFIQKELKDDARKNGRLTESSANAIREVAWACVRAMRETATAVAADESDVFEACRLRDLHEDLEDNLVLAAAERAHVDMIVTSDQQLLKKSPVPALAPSDAVKALKASRWGRRA